MRVIIAGSRDIMPAVRQDVFSWRMKCVAYAVKESGFRITTVLSGGARGIDAVGEAWAKEQDIEVERYPANWKKHGRAAGILRNNKMANNADALIAIWDGFSAGTRHMIETASARGLKIKVVKPNG